eukprot:scaffold5296_cov143-Pinguiococcus_pyrenoidosus.AAC.1
MDMSAIQAALEATEDGMDVDSVGGQIDVDEDDQVDDGLRMENERSVSGQAKPELRDGRDDE